MLGQACHCFELFKECQMYLLYKVCKYIYFILYSALFNLFSIKVERLLMIYIFTVYGWLQRETDLLTA